MLLIFCRVWDGDREFPLNIPDSDGKLAASRLQHMASINMDIVAMDVRMFGRLSTGSRWCIDGLILACISVALYIMEYPYSLFEYLMTVIVYLCDLGVQLLASQSIILRT